MEEKRATPVGCRLLKRREGWGRGGGGGDQGHVDLRTVQRDGGELCQQACLVVGESAVRCTGAGHSMVCCRPHLSGWGATGGLWGPNPPQ